MTNIQTNALLQSVTKELPQIADNHEKFIFSCFCWLLKHSAQNLNGKLDTSMYSGFENLYLSVVKNLGFTSIANDLTSATTFCTGCSSMPVSFTMSLPQMFTFLSYLVASISEAAAISLGLYFSRDASNMLISAMY